MNPNEGRQNYQIGMNPEYDRRAAEACRAESKGAQEARWLREAPGLMNTYQPLINDIEKPTPRPTIWQRVMAWFR